MSADTLLVFQALAEGLQMGWRDDKVKNQA